MVSPWNPSSVPSARPQWRQSALRTPAQRATMGVDIEGNPTSPNQTDGAPWHFGDADEIELGPMHMRGGQNQLERFSTRPGNQRSRKQSVLAAKQYERQYSDRQVVEQAKAYQTSHLQKSILSSCYSCVTGLRRGKPSLPPKKRLLEVVNNAFPPRMELPVLVCDIYANSGERKLARLGDIETYWKTKPSEVLVRWIHVPLGQGLLHSSIEDMFRHDWHPGRPFPHTGTPGFPYVEVESIHFRDSEQLQHMRLVRDVLQPLMELTDTLTDSCLAGDANETLESDLDWRETHLGQVRDFWELAAPDIPLELSESLSFQGPLRISGVGRGQLDRTCLGNRNDQFAGTKLVVAPFRCFHRTDGVILTMSAATGVDQLHKDFRVDVREPLEDRLTNPNSSIIGNIMAELEEKGASSWHRRTVEWFLVYLVTEIGTAPQNTASGRSALSLLSTLQNIIVELKKKRYDHWERRKTIELVQEYLICMDDLKLLSLSLGNRLEKFKNLLKDTEEHEKADTDDLVTPDNSEGQSSVKRAKWALHVITEDKSYVDHMYQDLTQALDSLFKLRSIEQNELAMVTESQNKALFIFTGVTVIFLPLSFFTSYYGMNLRGIRNTETDERRFWELCGSATFAIIAFILFSAMLYREARTTRWLKKREQELRYAVTKEDVQVEETPWKTSPV